MTAAPIAKLEWTDAETEENFKLEVYERDSEPGCALIAVSHGGLLDGEIAIPYNAAGWLAIALQHAYRGGKKQ